MCFLHFFFIVVISFSLYAMLPLLANDCSADSSLQQADFLRECVMVRDGLFTLPNWFLISDVDAIIDCVVISCHFLST